MKHFFAGMRGRLAATCLLLLALAGPAARAQAPAWQATVTTLGGYSYILTTAADDNGNVYLAGTFSGTLSLGALTLTSAGGDDVFVARWNSVRNAFAWAQRAGGTGYERATGIALNGTGVYVAGTFQSATISFGATTLANASATDDVFVAKLTDTGPAATFDWAQRVGGPGHEQAYALAAAGGNVYLAGAFDSATLGVGTTTLATAGDYDLFVAKLLDQGTTSQFAWAVRAGGTGADAPAALAVADEKVYVVGAFRGAAASFGPHTLYNTGAESLLVAKLVDTGSTGDFAWAQQAGPANEGQATAVAVRGSSVYVAGDFQGAAATFGGTSLASLGNKDVFVAKLTDAGATASFAWAQRAGGTHDDRCFALAVSGPSLYLAGLYQSVAASFGATALANANQNTSGDAFVAKLTDAGAAGSFAWALRAGGPNEDAARGLAIAGTTVFVTGYLSAPATFGSQVIAGLPNDNAAFLTALTDPTLLATAAAHSGLSFSLFPNPTRAATTITLPAQPGTAAATLTLLDALGRTRRTATVPLPAAGLRHELDLSGLAPGIYALQVRAGRTVGTQRLVVE
ncbi:T9SS type A sorting domain-containing protein [Hymenobacter sp. DH14]|uniref:T9SS type A sorting domain-containing protein n=1 Tax=Hymenobacter cyanobacteriorum TaxID=2926463 RepID=A0A9X1VK69_9BACT|nr:T9SS type A sorting domain-containing protein [Hymenobacter cyanobacteriorum]MCI1187901.1 T9SS type A sorting domain-containing protein [Hymenobacter cyanobacteriorum]